jgi:hypothetical protein
LCSVGQNGPFSNRLKTFQNRFWKSQYLQMRGQKKGGLPSISPFPARDYRAD